MLLSIVMLGTLAQCNGLTCWTCRPGALDRVLACLIACLQAFHCRRPSNAAY